MPSEAIAYCAGVGSGFLFAGYVWVLFGALRGARVAREGRARMLGEWARSFSEGGGGFDRGVAGYTSEVAQAQAAAFQERDRVGVLSDGYSAPKRLT